MSSDDSESDGAARDETAGGEALDKARFEANQSKLPDPYDLASAESSLNDTAKRLNVAWAGFLLTWVYFFVTTFSVTQVTLFRDAPVKLPVFNIELPLKVYFIVAPILFLALHVYLVVLTKGLVECLARFEAAMARVRPPLDAPTREALRARLDYAVNLRALLVETRDSPNFFDASCLVAVNFTTIALPLTLLVLTQLIFLPYQDQTMTWVHRLVVGIDVVFCFLVLRPRGQWWIRTRRVLFVLVVAVSSATPLLASFPGEWIYNLLEGTWPHSLTLHAFEGMDELLGGSHDPVDHVHHGSRLWFPNRFVLPDDSKLAEILGAASRQSAIGESVKNDRAGSSLPLATFALRGRSFRNAIFDRSNLSGVDFSGANLSDASMRNAVLDGAKFGCVDPAEIKERDEGVFGSYELIYHAESRCAVLERTQLEAAQLSNATFARANLAGADIRGAKITGSNFQSADLRGAKLSKITGSSAHFESSKLYGADLTQAALLAPVFSAAEAVGANFDNAYLPAANFSRAFLQGANFAQARLWAANFGNAYMQGADLSNAELHGALFDRAFLQSASLYGADIARASFYGTALSGASLKCVDAFQTDFRNADRDRVLLNTQRGKECEGHSSYTTSIDYSYPIDHDGRKFNLKTDILPTGGSYSSGFDDTWTSAGYGMFLVAPDPRKFDETVYATFFNRLVEGMSEPAKKQVEGALERLKPVSQTKEQSGVEQKDFADWVATASRSPFDYDEALTQRLASIACVDKGKPHVARGLLRAGRFKDRPDKGNTAAPDPRQAARYARNAAIIERLKKAARGEDDTCLGAFGLRDTDFPGDARAR